MVKSIVFDCSGVLAHRGLRDLMEEMAGPEIAKRFFDHLLDEGSPWLACDRGDIDTDECYRRLLVYYPWIDPKLLRDYLDVWPKCITPFPKMVPIVRALKDAGYPCYLLSNFTHRFPEVKAGSEVLQMLDGEVLSHEIHMLKPDREIYDYTAEKFGLCPAEILFADDTLENVEGAIAAGWQGYHFSTPEAFLQYLKENKIL